MGYYGFGNLGDEMLLKAIHSFLAPHRAIAFPAAFSPTEDALMRLNSFDYLILGGGGLFNRAPAPPFDTFDQWASQLKSPISVLGLGVEQLDSQFAPAIHCLVERTDFFIVRDAESKRLIGHPKVRVAPDLTFYEPLPRGNSRTDAAASRCGVNLRPLHRGVEAWIEAISALPCHKQALPFSLVPTYDDREPLAQLIGTWPEQVALDSYEQLDVVIGTAFHTIVFAIQAGIPAVAINYHPKVRRLMEEMGLAEFVLEWDEPQRLSLCFEKALTERDTIRERMAAYTYQAQILLASVLSEVRSTIETHSSSAPTQRIPASTYPQVTVFVLCQNGSQIEIGQTVSSCCNQTYPHIELVLVDCPAGLEVRELQLIGQNPTPRITCLHEKLSTERLLAMAGDYTTWVVAGSWFAEDALALMAETLAKQPDSNWAYSNYFITHNGNIDRKVTVRPLTQTGLLPFSSSFLARREVAAKLWEMYQLGKASPDQASIIKHAVHLSQPLFFKPATVSERNIYLAAIAYGRKQTERAQKYLSQAIQSEPELTRHAATFENAFHAFLDAGFNRLVTADPCTYLSEICAALPTTTQAQRNFARKFIGRASLELAFMYHAQGSLNQTRSSLLRAFWHNPALLANRGALWLWGESLVGRKTIEVVRQLRSHRSDRS